MPELPRDRLALLTHAARTAGDVVHVQFGTRHFYSVVHPTDIERVLVTNHRNYPKGPDHAYLKPVIGEGLITSEGAFHLKQRRAIQPAFHSRRIATYADAMTAYATEMLDRWPKEGVIDIAREMTGLTLRIVVRTLFGADVDDESDVLGRALAAMWAPAPAPAEGGRARTMLPGTRRASRELDEVIYAAVRERRALGRDTGDLLSMLLALGDDASGMPDRQVRDELMTLFFAGHETIASTLSWAWYLLAAHPDVEAALHAELDEVLAGRLPTAGDVSRLRYTTMALAETMRLYPPVWTIARRAAADDVVGGYRVPAGASVIVSPYVTHRDPRFYPDPNHFDPERFHPDHDTRKRGPRFAYFPFGGGVRQCMGEPFAWMEGTVLLATVAQRYRLRLAPGHPVEPQAMITLRPKSGVHVTIEAR